MSQKTLTGEIVEVKVPESKLSPAEKMILTCLRSAKRGLTHEQIRERMKLSGIIVFDNKLRSMRFKGFVESQVDESIGLLLWYATEKKEEPE